MRLFVEPMDAIVVEVSGEGLVRFGDEAGWHTPTFQERRAIVYAAEQEMAALAELIETLTSQPPGHGQSR